MGWRSGAWVKLCCAIALAGLVGACDDGGGSACDGGDCAEPCFESECEQGSGGTGSLWGSGGTGGAGNTGGTGGSQPSGLAVSGTIEITATLPGGQTDLNGTFAIGDDGSFVIEGLSGSVSGTATRNADGTYDLEVESATGLFADVASASVSGTLSSSGFLSLMNSSGVMLVGELRQQAGCDPEVVTTAVYFTHNECETAEVTIEGTTLGPLMNHYHEGGFCDQTLYDKWLEIGVNIPGVQSELLCNDFSLRDLNTGESSSHTACPSARFMLAPNSEYQYSVVWSNGETQSGSFRSGATCRNTPVCLRKGGVEMEECPVDRSNEPNIVTGFTGASIDFNNCTFSIDSLETSGCYPACIDVCSPAPEACNEELCADSDEYCDIGSLDVGDMAGDCMHDCTQTVAFLDELQKRPNPVLDEQELEEYEALLEMVGSAEAYPATLIPALLDNRYCGYGIGSRLGGGGPACAANDVQYSDFLIQAYYQCKLDSDGQ
jgi:hypothetical protein